MRMSSDAFLEMYRNYRARNLGQDESGSYSNADFVALLRQSLVADPELHRSLQNNAFEVIGGSSSQLEQRDLKAQLELLTRAFCVLEQAALNLYHYPWRKEFRTIKTYSGAYMHILKPVLSEADVAWMLGKLGYIMRRDAHGFVVESFPSAPELLKVACGFLAMQLECGILAEILSARYMGTVPLADLIQVRRGTRAVEACTERLQQLTLQLEKREDHVGSARSMLRPTVDYLDNLDIYRDAKETLDISSARTLGSLAESWDSHPGRTFSLNYKGNESELYSSEIYRPSKYTTYQEGDKFTQHDELQRSKTLSQSCSRSPTTCIHIPLPDGGIYSLHDCVFKTPALLYKCLKCNVLHDSGCPALQGCWNAFHSVMPILPSQAAGILTKVEQQ
uniref:Spermatogenesis-associated protein 2-like protein isoform X2 n=1 Tax=Geotrypetes seraphini TaxID=260995 RepID=A0A6P8RBI5_GEOSA|nr:spermatogenesis-associated protein 2-like protein isoform X2 [Geotrypetes seraphini]